MRFGLTQLLLGLEPKKQKERVSHYDALLKVELSEEQRDASFRKLPACPLCKSQDRLESVPEEFAKTDVIELEKAELRVLIEVVDNAEVPLLQLRWLRPLTKILKEAEV
jgi:hypothetical protein